MLPFFKQSAIPQLPDGYRIETSPPPTAQQLNALLTSCGESAHDAERWTLALERSLWHISIIKVECDELAGFVRATSDLALNANLWNLAAKPGADQAILFAVLVHRALHILRGRPFLDAAWWRCLSCLGVRFGCTVVLCIFARLHTA